MTQDISIELTDRIERIDALEDRMGITFEALYAVYKKDDYSSEVRINYDVIAPAGRISNAIKVIASAYNRNGQLIATTYGFLDEDNFVGFESCSERLDCDEPPSKIRLYPTSL